jgi:hypothetical protein
MIPDMIKDGSDVMTAEYEGLRDVGEAGAELHLSIAATAQERVVTAPSVAFAGE